MGLLKRIARKILESDQRMVTSQTSVGQMQNLISALRPRASGHELIRMGPDGDGGYLVPDDLSGITACLSPGVCSVSDFEKSCADLGMQVFMADKSVEGPASTHEKFHFIKKFVGSYSTNDFITMDEWVASSNLDTDSELLLQMDIEGFEYETLLNVSDYLMRRFRIIIIEFHTLDALWNQGFFKLAGRAFEKLLHTHACVHVHPNNCRGAVVKQGLSIPPVMEFTFLRKDRMSESSQKLVFPHPLDFDNTPNPTLKLPDCWSR